MSPVKREISDNMLHDYILDESLSETLLWAELTEPAEGNSTYPEIVDVLGCFSEQTGAQFG